MNKRIAIFGVMEEEMPPQQQSEQQTPLSLESEEGMDDSSEEGF